MVVTMVSGSETGIEKERGQVEAGLLRRQRQNSSFYQPTLKCFEYADYS